MSSQLAKNNDLWVAFQEKIASAISGGASDT